MQRRGLFLVLVTFFILTGLVLLGCKNITSTSAKDKTERDKDANTVSTVKGTIIAKVNNHIITLEDLNQEINAFNSIVPQDKPEARITTREKKIDYLKNELIRKTLLYQYALNKGMDKRQDIQQALEKTKQNLLVMELIQEETAKAEVSSIEIEDYYNKFKEQLKEPEERHIREIMVPTEAEAKEILIELLKGADFASLAKMYSKAESANKGGDLGFIQAGKKSPQFDAIAFSNTLEPGQYSNIIKTSEGYYIIKLEAIRGGRQKPLSELWEDIRRGLLFVKQQQRIEELIGRLSREAKIEIYESTIQ
ncbi:MAG: peptidylprolyl isomerase [Candidatus Omnitrophica bacterium]|nr:peptidylprolyl isomerase [Candidatus Omnitrophota bacterium]